jgi:hypothetical protein
LEEVLSDLPTLYARRFVQRRDVKAVQFRSGAYSPDRELDYVKYPANRKHQPLGWTMEHLNAHLNGTETYGHYLLDNEDQARLFCLDIDLEQEGFYLPMPMWNDSIPESEWEKQVAPIACNPREIWKDRTQIEARNWLKYQMGMLARKFTRIIIEQLGIGTAAAYSGNKGIHVYGFTGPMPAAQVREAALFALDLCEHWNLHRGQHIFKHAIEEPALGYQNFTLEIYPKQDSLKEKDLGNLLRLPLGRNLKSNDPTFFLDLRTPPGVMAPHPDPINLLETGNPYL